MSELVDDILADSFPASDPPSWTLGYVSSSLASSDTSAPDPEDDAPSGRADPTRARVAPLAACDPGLVESELV